MSHEKRMLKDLTVCSALRKILQMQGNSEFLMTSSGRLGKEMGLSQQSSSRIIINLVKEGYIVRDFDRRRQKIKITEKGIKLLLKEVTSLNSVMGIGSVVNISGTVFSGLGEGKYYLSREGYKSQFDRLLGYVPFPGTLNLKTRREDWNKLILLRSSAGIHVDGFVAEGRTFGAVKVFPASLAGIDCAVIMPERTVYTDVIEVISKDYLRGRLSLKDGNMITTDVRL